MSRLCSTVFDVENFGDAYFVMPLVQSRLLFVSSIVTSDLAAIKFCKQDFALSSVFCIIALYFNLW